MSDEPEETPARELEPTDAPPARKKREWKQEWITNRAPRVPSEVVAQRLTEIETALGIGYTDRQIAKRFAKDWGLTVKSVQTNYISRARRNIRERASLTRVEAKGASLDFWHRRMTRYLYQERQNEAILETERKREAELQERFDEATDADAQAVIGEELKRVAQKITRTMTELAALRANIHGMRDRADRIYGTLAPLKIADTDSEGNDRPRTPEEIRVGLVQLGVSVPSLPAILEKPGNSLPLDVEFREIDVAELPK